MKNNYPVFCIIYFLLWSSIDLFSQVQEFDTNKDNYIDQKEMRVIYLHKVVKAPWSDLDIDYDGVPDNDIIDAEVLDFVKRFSGTFPYPLAEIESYFKKKKSISLLVRSTHEDITVVDKSKSFKDAEAALFSYSKNYLKGEEGFIAKGAVILPINLSNDGTSILVPSLTFNRVIDPTEPSKNANSLVGRLGYSRLLFGKNDFHLALIRGYLSYATDFDFKSKVYAAELDVEFASPKLGLGGFKKSKWINFLEYRFNLYPHAEYGTVQSKGEKKNLTENEAFLRLGPRGMITLRPYKNKFKWLEFTTSYNLLWGLTGHPAKAEYLSQKVSCSLDEKKRFALSIEYNKGKVPLTLEEIENLLLGITIKL